MPFSSFSSSSFMWPGYRLMAVFFLTELFKYNPLIIILLFNFIY
ncbi:BgTH12-03384 [Blumeria graminis f. sp. triticale]|uniref:Bgt-51384 n=2 Tax=Blumeria graminis TaxID=34373 RepID=A0A9X9MK19_BLUGR|nr:BgTH12-03384 [Blumeria graminis f. sp. triticale]VDB89953.1 Bgt-51384 [Blumeria graminis f. sp. tritici]